MLDIDSEILPGKVYRTSITRTSLLILYSFRCLSVPEPRIMQWTTVGLLLKL